MPLTLQDLTSQRQSIARQREEALGIIEKGEQAKLVAEQARGALALLDHLIGLMQSDDALPADRLAEAVGGQGAEVVGVEKAS